MIDAEEVRGYWTIVGVLVGAVVATLALALVRRAPRVWAWHLMVAALGGVASLVFAVTSTGTPHDDPGPAPTHQTGPHCYSGGDSRGCPGG